MAKATFVTGYYGSKKGSRDRIQKDGKRLTPRNAAKDIDSTTGTPHGLPMEIRGNPLGCGCSIAHLTAVGEPNESGEVEADYQCASRWHNYVVFQVAQKKKAKKKVVKKKVEEKIQIDKFGKEIRIGGAGFSGGELEEL